MRGAFAYQPFVLPTATRLATHPAVVGDIVAARANAANASPTSPTALSGGMVLANRLRGGFSYIGQAAPAPATTASNLFSGPGTYITSIPDGYVYVGGAVALWMLFSGRKRK